MEMTLTNQGDFQAPDKIKGVAEHANEKESYIAIGTTCFLEIEAYGENNWERSQCEPPSYSYLEFIPTKDTLMDLGINTVPELIDGKQGRPTAYLIDNGGSTDLSLIEHTTFYQDFFSDDALGVPQKFRIQYWVNAANFRLMDLAISFYIPPESVTNHDKYLFKKGSFVDVAFVLEYRPLTEKIPDINAPSIPTAVPPTPTPTPTPTPLPKLGKASIRTIVFSSNIDGDYEIYHYQPTQQGVSLFFNLTDNDRTDLDPNVSPDGESILFTSNKDGDREIYFMGVFGTDKKNLTNNPADDATASWSPDGSKIVFASNRSGVWSIYTMNADGSNQEELVSLPAANIVDPVYSPDGRYLAFHTINDGDIYLYNIYLDTLFSVRDLNPLFTPKVIGGLDWSPDGSSLVFYGDPDPTDGYKASQLEIFTIDSTGNNFRRLTKNFHADADPRWAPDGNTIYYVTEDFGFKLRSMSPDDEWEGDRLTTLSVDINEFGFDINGKSISPVTAIAFFNTGVTYENLGYLDYAVNAYTEAIRLNPQDPLSYQYRGDAYQALGKSTEAEADFAKAKELGFK